jgi:aspartate aminotransferase
MVIDLLKEIPGIKTNIPDGAFYVFPEVDSYFGKSFENYKINNADDLCMYILETEYVGLVSGGAFGNSKCMRISYATSKEILIEAIIRIKRALSKLN